MQLVQTYVPSVVKHNGSMPRVPAAEASGPSGIMAQRRANTVGIKNPSGKFHVEFFAGVFCIL